MLQPPETANTRKQNLYKPSKPANRIQEHHSFDSNARLKVQNCSQQCLGPNISGFAH